ncbi:aspartate kinase [Bacteroidales bacterium OttesenSCG-928-M11]|nr:aspartate kinase [Bacteroidales bacterium OttesenSCG-928-M11]
MQVLKFGGSSIGSVSKMNSVVSLLNDGKSRVVVFSAMAGMTSSLSEVADYLYKKNPDGANEIINHLEQSYCDILSELFLASSYKEEAQDLVRSSFDYIRSFTKDIFTLFEEKAILAQGEILSSSIMYFLMKDKGIKVSLLPALDFMRTDKNSEPDPIYIREKLTKLINENDADVYVTQGHICRNAYGEIDNFNKGGSDLSASLIGAALSAEEIQIWTDVEGMQNNDPRYVENTAPVEHLLFEEAAELAYFGVKILHPSCILPAKLNRIPVRLMNIYQPEFHGTLISNKMEKRTLKAVAAKDGIIAIKVKSTKMLLAHGFLRRVFEIFESYQTPIDMVTTSEVGVSVTIDQEKHLDDILNDLKKFGTVTVDYGMSLICVVGDLDWANVGFESKIINALNDIPVRMISYGGSNYNISFLIKTEDKVRALQTLNNTLFN